MRLLFFVVFSFFTAIGYAQPGADLVIGKWLKTPKDDLIIQVYKSNDEYKGKIAWTKGADSAKLAGYPILEGLRYNEKDKSWTGGRIRNPRTGSTYKAVAKIRANGELEVLAYKGMKFIGRKKYFKKVK
jgi:hypothetical protein